MHKFMMIFNKPTNLEPFENRYNDLLALVERMPYIIRRQVINVYGSPFGDPRIYRILEVYFDSREQMEDSLKSKSGQEAGAELFKFPARTFEMIFAEVYEEAGGRTSTTNDSTDTSNTTDSSDSSTTTKE
jgi:uncharacterized protein (TIGR02118 family)